MRAQSLKMPPKKQQQAQKQQAKLTTFFKKKPAPTTSMVTTIPNCEQVPASSTANEVTPMDLESDDILNVQVFDGFAIFLVLIIFF